MGALSDSHAISFRQLMELGFTGEHLRAFRKALLLSGKESVDAFLEHRPEFIEIGKLAIAQDLLRFENDNVLFNSLPNWYSYLFRKLNAPFERFEENRLSVVTFNYDRSLEHFLHTALLHSSGRSPEEVSVKLRAVPIVHVHGQMGLLPWQTPEESLPFSPPPGPDAVQRASKGIRIIHEQQQEEEAFAHARRLVRDAARLVFLGFGFDETNLQRLGAPVQGTPGRPILASCFGLTNLECQAVVNRFGGGIALGDPSMEALRFLREMVLL